MAHLEDRLRERTSLPNSAIPRLKKEISSSLRGKLPKGEAHHVKLPGGSFAVIKNVKDRPILASFLSADMTPPGEDLTQLTGVNRLREAIKAAAFTSEEEAEAVMSSLSRDIKPNEAVSQVSKTQFKVPKVNRRDEARLSSSVSTGADPSLVRTAAVNPQAAISLLRRAHRASDETGELGSPESVGPARLPVNVGDVVMGVGGFHPDYAKFTQNADPRLAAILLELKKRAGQL